MVKTTICYGVLFLMLLIGTGCSSDIKDQASGGLKTEKSTSLEVLTASEIASLSQMAGKKMQSTQGEN